MAKVIQLRNLPDHVYRVMESRAAKKGLSLSKYLVEVAAEIASQPPTEEMLDRLAKRSSVKLTEPSAKLIRRGRVR